MFLELADPTAFMHATLSPPSPHRWVPVRRGVVRCSGGGVMAWVVDVFDVPVESDRAAEFLTVGVIDIDFAVEGVEVDGPAEFMHQTMMMTALCTN